VEKFVYFLDSKKMLRKRRRGCNRLGLGVFMAPDGVGNKISTENPSSRITSGDLRSHVIYHLKLVSATSTVPVLGFVGNPIPAYAP
jgi:hypothetical protein